MTTLSGDDGPVTSGLDGSQDTPRLETDEDVRGNPSEDVEGNLGETAGTETPAGDDAGADQDEDEEDEADIRARYLEHQDPNDLMKLLDRLGGAR